MNTPLLIMSVLVMIAVYGVVINNLRTGKFEFLSWRNIFLLGFAQFYGIGTYLTITDNFGSDIYIPGENGRLKLFFAMPLFVIFFLIFMNYGAKWGKSLRRVIPAAELPITDAGIIITLCSLLGAAIFAATVPMGSYLTVLISQFRGGLSGAAAGLATYYLISRRFNPLAWGIFVGTFGMCFLIGMVGESGRRGILGVFMSVGWMWWYFSLKEKSVPAKIVRLAAIGALTFTMVAFYASFRGVGGSSMKAGGGYTLALRVQQMQEFMKNPTLQTGAIKNMLGSDAPTDTMFIMENYPETYAYDPFNGLKYFLVNPIPRFLWPNKPIGMGVVVQKQLNTPANLGIGILGHGWSEGGWLGIVGYAVFFGLLIGALDRLIRERSWNPYFLAIIGSNLGNVFALARGETSLFLVLVVSGIIGVYGVIYAVRMVFRPIMASGAPLLTAGNRWILEAPAESDEPSDEYDGDYAEMDAYDARLQAAYERGEDRVEAPTYSHPSRHARDGIKEAG